MSRYINLPLAYAFQIIWCLTWTFMVYLFGYRGMAFGVVGALRPIVLKMERISKNELPLETELLNTFIFCNYIFRSDHPVLFN